MNIDKRVHDRIKKAYAAYNSRDIDTLLSGLHPDVEWPRAFEGGHVIGHGALRAYWTKLWTEVDPHVELVGSNGRPDGTVEVSVHQIINDLQGNAIVNGIVKHVYTLQEGLLRRMDVELGSQRDASAIP